MSTPRAVQDVVTRQAEKQLRVWSRRAEVIDRIEHEHELEVVKMSMRPFIAISRETGAAASEVALAVADELQWEVLDRDLLHRLAQEAHVSERQIAHLDETGSTWITGLINHWINSDSFNREQYLSRLRLLLLRATRLTSHVIVGRGAQFLLPRESGMAVRVIAPLRKRIERVMRKYQWPRSRAEAHIQATDSDRDSFVREFFHHDVSDPHLYDLVINMEFFDVDSAASLIVGQFQRRFPDSL